MEQVKTNGETAMIIECMAQDVIAFLKQEGLWETSAGLVYNGFHVDHKGITKQNENLMGVMRIWYEGPLAKAVDTDVKVWTGLETIMAKYGYYPQPYSYCDLNVYPM